MQVKRKIETKEIICPHCQNTVKIYYCGLLPEEDFTGKNVNVPCPCPNCKKPIMNARLENYSTDIVKETGLMPFSEEYTEENIINNITPIKIENGYVIYDKEV